MCCWVQGGVASFAGIQQMSTSSFSIAKAMASPNSCSQIDTEKEKVREGDFAVLKCWTGCLPPFCFP